MRNSDVVFPWSLEELEGAMVLASLCPHALTEESHAHRMLQTNYYHYYYYYRTEQHKSKNK